MVPSGPKEAGMAPFKYRVYTVDGEPRRLRHLRAELVTW
jgi:hypothetical protein